MILGRLRMDHWSGGTNLFWNESVLQIKYPWNKPLFSERYGYRSPNFKIFGLRFFIEIRERFPDELPPG